MNFEDRMNYALEHFFELSFFDKVKTVFGCGICLALCAGMFAFIFVAMTVLSVYFA